MSTEQITTSAALYFKRQPDQSVPLLWLQRLLESFADFGLRPILFSADGSDFLLDDCYVLADPGGEIVDREGYVCVARGHDLSEALINGNVRSLVLDSPCIIGGDRSNWRAMADISMAGGSFYLGIDENLFADSSLWLRRAYAIAKGLLDVRYGIAYKMPLAQCPECYATGPNAKITAVGMFRDFLQPKERTSYGEGKGPDEIWADEINNEGRHIDGLFRGAYPASILSDSHLRRAALLSYQVGTVSELNASLLWLWELSNSEIPIADGILAERNALVSQAQSRKAE